MNKKQIFVTFILAMLMILLFFVEKLFDNKFNDITVINNNMGKLEEYYMKNGEFSYSLPNSWSKEEIVSEKCGIYKVQFKDSDNNIIGSIELITNSDSIDTIAKNDIDNMILQKDKEEIEEFQLGNNKGIKVKYKTKVSNRYNYINSGYYIPMNSAEKIKVTFIVKEDNYNDDMCAVFNTIVESINK
ncbi:hypothetical protein SAMN04487886_102030 [Clostridium sp. DSM 8431]|uniref:hypothetical protein n=1 Tax=Clostridium sp. DSM 8431 TaxID=1761781 RepID=UPI0008E3EE9F|nr:hypothetical protein [Clostridium sp. DSM 8431]SFU40735.1 hypothetical protein SAMN04487886_102030 [Clostridium sp. DSM 8431]